MGRIAKDITGQTFGRLTAISRAPGRNDDGAAYWHCKCDCGAETIASGPNLRSGHVVTCGRHKATDLTGQKFGKLTVVARAENGNADHSRWHCKCDCGTENTVYAHNLKSGLTQSCGCSRRGRRSRTHIATLIRELIEALQEYVTTA